MGPSWQSTNIATDGLPGICGEVLARNVLPFRGCLGRFVLPFCGCLGFSGLSSALPQPQLVMPTRWPAEWFVKPIVPERDGFLCVLCNRSHIWHAELGRAFSLFVCIHCAKVHCGFCMMRHMTRVSIYKARLPSGTPRSELTAKALS